MKIISKKVISVILCFAVLASLAVNLAFADNSADEQKTAIINAWQAIASETKTVKKVVGVPREEGYTDAYSQTVHRTEVTDNTNVGIADNALLGTYYVDKFAVCKTDAGDVCPAWNPRMGFKLLEGSVSGYDALYFYAATYKADGSYGSAKIFAQSHVNGAQNDDASPSAENVGAWTKISFKTGYNWTNVGVLPLGGTATYFSIGSLIGEFTVNGPALPDGYENMSVEELVYAASQVDYTGFPSSSAFEEALLAVGNAESVALIAAWKKLSYVQSTVIGYSNGAEEITNIPAELNLTDEQKAQMGTHYTAYTGVTNKSTSFSFPYKGKSLEEFEKITFSYYADPTAAISFLLAFGNDNYNYEYYATFAEKGFKTVDITENIRSLTPAFLTGEQTLNAVAYHYWGGSGNLYAGSILGWKTVYAEVVPNAANMTTAELYEAACKVDLSKYTTGVEEFKTALDNIRAEAYPEAKAVIDAWKNLSYEQSTVIGYSTGVEEIANIPAELNLTDEQKAQMGTHYTAYTGVTNKATSFSFPYKGKSLEEFDKITFSIYTDPTAAISFLLAFGNDNYNYEYYATFAEKGFKTVDITENIRSQKPAFLTGEQKLNAVAYHYWGGSGDLYVGSILGWKTVKAELPQNISNISLKELYLEAASVDASKFTVGADEFIAARTELYNLLEAQGMFDAEGEATDNLIAAWRKISADTKNVTKVVAVPNSKGAVDVNSYEVFSKEVTPDTVVDGLADTSVLGTHYVDKYQAKADDTVGGWGNQYFFEFLENPIKDYDELYFYVATYKADGSTGAAQKVYAQNNLGDDYGTTLENVGSWQKLSMRTGLTLTSMKVVPIGTGCTYISFGSLIGKFTVSGPALPENYGTLTLTDLVRIAKKSDYEGFANTEEFKAALAAAEALVDTSPDLAQKLIEEWRKLVIEETRVVAVPSTAGAKDIYDNTVYSKEVTPDTVVEGLADTSVLGTHYVDKFQVSADDTIAGWGNQYTFEFLENPIKNYSELYFYVATYKADGSMGAAQKVYAQNNLGDDYGTTLENVGSWRKLSMRTGLTLTSMKVVPIGNGCSYLSFGSIIGVFEKRPDMPENVEELCFDDLVKAATACDVSGFEADAFKAVLKECQDLIAKRRLDVLSSWDALGIAKPENADALGVAELAKAALDLDLSVTEADTIEFGNAVWMLNLLTDDGRVLDNLRDAWKKIASLPDDYRLLSAGEWVVGAEALDISETEETLQDNFAKALEAVRDITSRGNSDITELKKLCDDASTMNYYDFTDATWKPFGKALASAKEVLENYSKVTQKTVDAAKDELLAAWGELRMYVRTQWVDFYGYLIEEEPGMGLNRGSNPDTTVSVSKVEIPNGANAAFDIENQKGGWYPVGAGGVRLENLSKYEFLEVWIKAEPDQKMSSLLWQLNKSGGGWTFDAGLTLPDGAKCGEWYRLEFPLANFINPTTGSLVGDEEYQAYSLQFMVQGGDGTYSLSNIAAVRTEAVEAGVVPNVPKMEIKEREGAQAAAPPKNPFEGVDRNDPWGLLEKANKPKDEQTTTDSTESETVVPEEDNTNNEVNKSQDSLVTEEAKDNESDEYKGDDSWGTEEPEESESEEAELIGSGACGKKLTWNFYSDGTLIIEGTGAMEDYEEMAPWVEAGYDVKTVIINDGVTSIGDSAFYGCKNLVSLKVPATVTRVGAFAFYECYSLTELKVSSSVKEIGAYAFGFVFDAENNTAKVLEGFELSVCEPSEALKYAKTYEVPYEVYKTADTVTVEDGYAWWFWTLIAAGAVILVAAATVLVIIFVKKKKNANKMEVVK